MEITTQVSDHCSFIVTYYNYEVKLILAKLTMAKTNYEVKLTLVKQNMAEISMKLN